MPPLQAVIPLPAKALVTEQLPPDQFAELRHTLVAVVPSRKDHPILSWSLGEISDDICRVLSSNFGTELSPLLYGSRAGQQLGGPPAHDWDFVVLLPPKLQDPAVQLLLEAHLQRLMENLIQKALVAHHWPIHHEMIKVIYGLHCKPIPVGGLVCHIGEEIDIVFKFGGLQSYSALDAFYIDLGRGAIYCLDGTHWTTSITRFQEMRGQLKSRLWQRLGPSHLSFLRLLHHLAHGSLIDVYELEAAYARFKQEPNLQSLYQTHLAQHFPDPAAKLIDMCNLLTLVQDKPKECYKIATNWFVFARSDPGLGVLVALVRDNPELTPTFLSFIRGCVLYAYSKQKGKRFIEAWVFPEIAGVTTPRNFFAIRCRPISRFLWLSPSPKLISPTEVMTSFLEALEVLYTERRRSVLPQLEKVVATFQIEVSPFVQLDIPNLSSALEEFANGWNRMPLKDITSRYFAGKAACPRSVLEWIQSRLGSTPFIRERLAHLDIQGHMPSVIAMQQQELGRFLRHVINCCEQPISEFGQNELGTINQHLRVLADQPGARDTLQAMKHPLATVLLPRVQRVLNTWDNGRIPVKQVVEFVRLATADGLFLEDERDRLRDRVGRAFIGCCFDYEDQECLRLYVQILSRQPVVREKRLDRTCSKEKRLFPIELVNTAIQKVYLNRPLQSALRLLSFRHYRFGKIPRAATVNPSSVLKQLTALAVGCSSSPHLDSRQKIATELVMRWPRIMKLFNTREQLDGAYECYHRIQAVSGAPKKLRAAVQYYKSGAPSKDLGWAILSGTLMQPLDQPKVYKTSGLQEVLLRVIGDPAEFTLKQNRQLDDLLLLLFAQPDEAHFPIVQCLFSRWRPPKTFVQVKDRWDSLTRYLETLSERSLREGNRSLSMKYYQFAKITLSQHQFDHYVNSLKQFLDGEISGACVLRKDRDIRMGSLIDWLIQILAVCVQLDPLKAQRQVEDLVSAASTPTGQLACHLSRLIHRADGVQLFQDKQSRKRVGLKLLADLCKNRSNQAIPEGWKHLQHIHKLSCPLGSDANDLLEIYSGFAFRLYFHAISRRTADKKIDMSQLIAFWHDYWIPLTARPQAEPLKGCHFSAVLLLAFAFLPVALRALHRSFGPDVHKLLFGGGPLKSCRIFTGLKMEGKAESSIRRREEIALEHLSNEEYQAILGFVEIIQHIGNEEEQRNAREAHIPWLGINLYLDMLQTYCTLSCQEAGRLLTAQSDPNQWMQLFTKQLSICRFMEIYIDHVLCKEEAITAKARWIKIRESISANYNALSEKRKSER